MTVSACSHSGGKRKNPNTGTTITATAVTAIARMASLTKALSELGLIVMDSVSVMAFPARPPLSFAVPAPRRLA